MLGWSVSGDPDGKPTRQLGTRMEMAGRAEHLRRPHTLLSGSNAQPQGPRTTSRQAGGQQLLLTPMPYMVREILGTPRETDTLKT